MRIGVIDPFPDQLNAEVQYIQRLAVACEALGHELVVFDAFGRVWDLSRNRTGELIYEQDLSFAISLHFATGRPSNHFVYGNLWNPPEYFDLGLYGCSYRYFMDLTLGWNDYLSAGSERCDSHHANFLSPRRPGASVNQSPLYFSANRSHLKPRPLVDPGLFYIGTNWDQTVNLTGQQSRYGGLLKMLDAYDFMRFYGPSGRLGDEAKPRWHGYDQYAGQLPFDSGSVVQAIHDTGACLVLSSPYHRAAEVASARIFEACSAGVPAIADDNRFMVRHFGDSVRFVSYDGDVRAMAQEVAGHLEDLRRDPQGAAEMAARAQDIFDREFSLEVCLDRIAKQHRKRYTGYVKKEVDAGASITLVVTHTHQDVSAPRVLDRFVGGLNSQLVKSIDLRVVCDRSLKLSLESALKGLDATKIKLTLLPVKLFDRSGQDPKRLMTTGAMLAHGLKSAFTGPVATASLETEFYFDHFGVLSRSLSATAQVSAVYSYSNETKFTENASSSKADRAATVQDIEIIRQDVSFMHSLEYQDIVAADDWFCRKDCMLFRHDVVKPAVLGTLPMFDGLEHFYLLAQSLRHGEVLPSYRLTLCHWTDAQRTDQEPLADPEWQKKLIADVVAFDARLERRMPAVREVIKPAEIDESTLGSYADQYLAKTLEHRPWLYKTTKWMFENVVRRL